MTCWLAQFSDEPCDGRLVRCHLVPKQVIRREFPVSRCADLNAYPRGYAETLCADMRSWVWGCGGPCGNGGHHGMLDIARTLRIPRSALPSELEAFAADHGLDWWLTREYGLLEDVAA